MSGDERVYTWVPNMRWGDESLPAIDGALNSALLDNITARVCVIDRREHCLYANREWLEFLGRPAHDVVGRHMSEILGPDIYPRYAPLAERIFAGEGLRVEGWVEYPVRGRRYLKEVFVPYAPGGGPVQAIATFGRDQTELKLREQELAQRLSELETSEALKSAIVDHALAALISTDDDGRIVEFNPAAEAIFGQRREAVIGASVSDVIMPERYRARHLAGMQRMRDGAPGRILGKRVEMHAVRADGSEFPMEMVLWRTNVGSVDYYTASIADLSERHAAQDKIDAQREALRQSEKLSAMGSLLAGVAHELNNPLAIVMGRASLLEEKCDGAAAVSTAELKADVLRIRDAAERCGRIVRTFLNMARARPSQRGEVGLNDLVNAAVEMLQYGYRSHGVELDSALGTELPTVNADGDQIGQIVMNLLVNAQQAFAGVPRPHRVRVATGVESPRPGREPRVWLRVHDNGPGVDAALAAQIFEPFFTTKPEGAGTGLGLAVSRSIARAHGGDLILEAPGPHGGASFRLSLPVSGVAQIETAPGSLSVAEAAPSTRILVVDDETDLAELMRDMLESAGHEVATAESGAVALELLASARFDAIVSDLRMPDMDGAALFREISVRYPALARRLVFVTGDTLSPDAREFLQRSRCAALDKPFSKADLLNQVARLLR